MRIHIINAKSVNVPLPFRTKGKIHYLLWNLNTPFCSCEKHFKHVYFESALLFFNSDFSNGIFGAE